MAGSFGRKGRAPRSVAQQKHQTGLRDCACYMDTAGSALPCSFFFWLFGFQSLRVVVPPDAGVLCECVGPLKYCYRKGYSQSELSTFCSICTNLVRS